MKTFKKPDVIDRLRPYSHTVLEASAGTGKTYALEHIVLDLLIREFANIDEILVLTYTERATSELKKRIRALIEAALKTEETETDGHWVINKKVETHLTEQLDQFARASIHTIHGFCHRILTENAFHLNRPLHEEQDSISNIFDRAFKRALREKISTTSPYSDFLETWLRNRQLSKLQYELEAVCRHEDALYPEFRDQKLLEVLETVTGFDAPVEGFRADIRSEWMVDRARDLVDAAQRYDDHQNLPQFLVEADEPLGWLRRSRAKSKQATMVEIANLKCSSAESAAVRRLFLDCVPMEVATIQLLRRVVAPYLQEEKDRGYFDFDDMLTGVHSKLDEHSPGSEELRAFLRARYRFALVDEFQDTDAKQWDILRRLFLESPSEENPLIIIGDPKQSIYGWRGADVYTYMDARATVETKTQKPPVQLRTNFRSTDVMIDAYNAIFDQTDRHPFFDGAIQYPYPVDCGEPEVSAFRADLPLTPIELLSPQPEKDEKLDAFLLKRVLGRRIAWEIDQLLKNPIVTHDKDGHEKTVTASDIFILTHTHEEARFLGRHLRQFGIQHAYFKQEGLFQSEEAAHVLDVLRAVARPYETSRRLKAWATPFFCAPWRDLRNYADLPETDPFFAQLLEWHALAIRREFENLFAQIIDQTGIAQREIFDGFGYRKLTNYTHILETLLIEAQSERLEIDDVVVRLFGFIEKSKLTERDERNIQRLDTNEDAVQLMTIHTSKGLEADVIFLYGGFTKRRSSDGVRFIHHDGTRAMYYGPPQSQPARDMMDEQTRGETQRVLYVALTRARVKTYIPYIPVERGKPVYPHLDGHHAILNARLASMIRRDVMKPEHFKLTKAYVGEWTDPATSPPTLRDFSDVKLPDPPPPIALDHRPTPLVMTSYSRMKKGAYEVESFQGDASRTAQPEDDLPSGTTTGIFLHELLETVDLPDLRKYESFEDWSKREDISAWCVEKMESQGIDPRFETRCLSLVWQSVKTPFDVADGANIPSIAECDREKREVEFHVPIPQSDHPLSGFPTDGPLRIDRGFFKGYIDLVFEHDDRVYFADWKSDALESFDPDVVDRHVARNYGVQANLYTLALTRMFQIETEAQYTARIGGFVYVFMRGIDGQPNRGFYTGQLSWEELCEYREQLLTTELS